jgi:hypothetical protein
MTDLQLREALDSLSGNIARAAAAMPPHETWLRGFAAQDLRDAANG